MYIRIQIIFSLYASEAKTGIYMDCSKGVLHIVLIPHVILKLYLVKRNAKNFLIIRIKKNYMNYKINKLLQLKMKKNSFLS